MSIIKEQILLGSASAINGVDVDTFLNIELKRNFNEIRVETIDNIFDLSNEYNLERNNSLKFCIYGKVTSKYIDTNNLTITLQTNSGDTMYSPKITDISITSTTLTTQTVNLSNNNSLSQNIFGYNQSSYFFLFELNKSVLSGGTRIANLIINDNSQNLFYETSIPIVIFDVDTNILIPYGTNTSDLNLDGSITVINNDFPFFYDRHWVKQNIDVAQNATILFTASTFSVNENIQSGTAQIPISLQFPSLYGRESATVYLDSSYFNSASSFSNSGTSIFSNLTPEFTFSPQTFSWNIGDQTQYFNINIINDLYSKPTENLIFKIKNVENGIISQENGSTNVMILNTNRPSQANFSIAEQKIIENDCFVKIHITLDKPVQVPNQSVYISCINRNDELTASSPIIVDLFENIVSSTPGTVLAVVGQDFTLDPNDNGATAAGNGTTPLIIFSASTQPTQTFSTIETIILTAITPNNVITSGLVNLNNVSPVSNTNIIPVAHQDLSAAALDFSKQIPINTGITHFSTTIRLSNNLSYDVGKKIIIQLNTDAQNIVIGPQTPTYTLHIINDIVTQFATFIIPGNNDNGIGTYRVTQAQNPFVPLTHYFWQTFDSSALTFNQISSTTFDPSMASSFMTDFTYTLTIINNGFPVPFQGQMIPQGGIIFQTMLSGYTGLEISLPTNEGLNNSNPNNLFYERANYTFQLSTKDFTYYVTRTDNGQQFTYPLTDKYVPLSINTLQQNSTLGVNANSNYYLTTVIADIISNTYMNGVCANANIAGSKTLSEITINGTVLLPSGANRFTTIRTVEFLQSPYDVLCGVHTVSGGINGQRLLPLGN